MVRPESCAGVSVQLPPPLLVPADSVASSGTLPMVIDSFFSNDTAPAETYTLSLHDALPILSSVPLAADTVRLGASACSATETVIEPVVEARLPPSLAVAVTDRVKLGSSAEVAVMVRPGTDAHAPVLQPPPKFLSPLPLPPIH